MKKQDMINRMIEEDIEDIKTECFHDDIHFLYNILAEGWKGYDKMNLKEVKEEYKSREYEEIDCFEFRVCDCHTPIDGEEITIMGDNFITCGNCHNLLKEK